MHIHFLILIKYQNKLGYVQLSQNWYIQYVYLSYNWYIPYVYLSRNLHIPYVQLRPSINQSKGKIYECSIFLKRMRRLKWDFEVREEVSEKSQDGMATRASSELKMNVQETWVRIDVCNSPVSPTLTSASWYISYIARFLIFAPISRRYQRRHLSKTCACFF